MVQNTTLRCFHIYRVSRANTELKHKKTGKVRKRENLFAVSQFPACKLIFFLYALFRSFLEIVIPFTVGCLSSDNGKFITIDQSTALQKFGFLKHYLG